ncbi:hypothetical protein SAMN04515655_11021 [Halanaerobium congolense]|nr:hypothetical protein [Halanaerobium congolense]SDK65724.1 hypothetical protein SAMN04515655_11021 [Halanaerobium congolense]SDM32101.1 hypothetical protein SAMN04488599_10921 [Halanaerobium congolense]
MEEINIELKLYHGTNRKRGQDFINKILSYYEILDLLFIDKNPEVYYNYNQKDLYEI